MKKQHIRQTYTLLDLCIVAGITIIGAAFIPFGGSMATLGGTIIAIGISCLPFLRHGYRIHGYKGTYRLEEILVPREHQNAIMTFLQGESPTLNAQAGKTSGALIEIYRKKGDNTLLARYFDYKLHMEGTDFPILQISSPQLEELRKIQVKPEVF